MNLLLIQQRMLRLTAIIAAALLCTACKFTVLPTEGGKVLSASGNRDCVSVSCAFDAGSGLSETFTAQADQGFKFAGWTGWLPCENSDKTCVVDIDDLSFDVTLTATFVPEVFLGEVEVFSPAFVTINTINFTLITEPDAILSFTPPNACGAWDSQQLIRRLHDSGRSGSVAVQVAVNCDANLQLGTNYSLLVRADTDAGYRQSTVDFALAQSADLATRTFTVDSSQHWTKDELQEFFKGLIGNILGGVSEIPPLLNEIILGVANQFAEKYLPALTTPQTDVPIVTDSITFASIDPAGVLSEQLSGLIAYPDISDIDNFTPKDSVVILYHATSSTPSLQDDDSDTTWFLAASLIAAKGYVVITPDNYGIGKSEALTESYLQAQHVATNGIDMLAAVQAAASLRSVLPSGDGPLKVDIVGYSSGAHSAVSTMMQLLLGHQDDFEVSDVYAGTGPYALYETSIGVLEKLIGSCSNAAYCEDVAADFSKGYLISKIGPGYLAYRDTGLEMTDVIIDDIINPSFITGVVASESQYDAFKTNLQIDSFTNVLNYADIMNTATLALYHSTADMAIAAQNSRDMYDVVSEGVVTELKIDICSKPDLLRITDVINDPELIHILCGVTTLNDVISKL